MKSNVIKRLARYMKSSGTNAYRLWDITGIYPANTYHWLAGHSKPNADYTARLEKFLSKRWA